MTPGLAYPLSHAVEYQPGVHHEGQHCSNFYQAPPAGPFAIKPPLWLALCLHRARQLLVRRRRCAPRSGAPDYDELILKEATQALPAYRLYFRYPY